MKKITFILFALIAGTTFSQTSISSNAEIIEAISFEQNSPLSFGKVDNTAGTYTVGNDGSFSGSKTQLGTATAGALTVSGQIDEAYFIKVSETATLTHTDNTNTLSITAIESTVTGTGTLDAEGKDAVIIGGTLNVTEGQTSGTYNGAISVTVSYN